MEADICLFMGQSNMAGRGDAALAPMVTEGAGYEYRAVTNPGTLVPLKEPFGVWENREGGVFEPGKKTGSMVSSFVNACFKETGRPIIAVSCSKGDSSIDEWIPGMPYFTDAVSRYEACMDYVRSQEMDVHSVSMVWCQGCADAVRGMDSREYKEKTLRFFDSFRRKGVERIFLVKIGSQRDLPKLCIPIQEAQEELADGRNDIIMVSRQFASFRERGLMKDTFHYKQEGYNLVGEEAGSAAGRCLR